MSGKLKAKSSIYTYLKASGVLEHGTPIQIQQARKAYWKEYRRKWRKDKREYNKEFTISFSAEERKDLTREAKRHNLSQTKFIKFACSAYMSKSYVVPDSMEIKRIAQHLALAYNEIQQLLEDDRIEGKVGREALESIWQLERHILPLLNNPKPIETYITEHIQKNLRNKTQLLKLIHTL